MTEMPLQNQMGRTWQGRFARRRSGNYAARPTGSRDHATRTAEILLDGEAEALTRKAVELALGGDATALRLCLDRIIAPRRDRPVRLAIPRIWEAADIAGAIAAITAAVARGDITPSEPAELANIVEAFVRAIETSDCDRRLRLLEASHAAGS